MSTMYTDDNIANMTQMELMRSKPSFAIGGDDVKGQVHAVGEIIANSKDELPYVQNGSIELTVFVNHNEQRYQIVVSDSGRGVPLKSLTQVFTRPNTSAKYDQDAYNSSAGMFGIGAKATLAVTKRFRAISARDKDTNTIKGTSGYASVTTNALTIVEETILNDKEHSKTSEHGTIVAFEFDPGIMTGMDSFYNGEGIQLVIDIMQKWHLFMPNCLFSVRISDKPIEESFWTTDILSAIGILDKSKETSRYLYNSTEWDDPFKYLSIYWGISNNLSWETTNIQYTQPDNKMSYQLMMFLPKRISSGGIISFVNDVQISRTDSSQIASLYTTLKKYLSKYIEDKAIKSFFMDSYKFPMYMALNVRYSGALFAGATKEYFRNSEFQKKFEPALEKSFAEIDSHMELLYSLIADNIRIEYNKAFNKPLEVRTEQKLMLQLNHAVSYFDASEYGPNSELFIVEGTSAAGAAKQRLKYQAMYATRGKPLNAAIAYDTPRQEAIRRLTKDKVWQDLIKIIGIQPGNDDQDLSTLRFGKLCVMHDADADGSHIEAIYTTNFYILNPRIVSEGYLWISKPPLFSLQRKSSNKHKFFMFDEPAIMDFRALLYHHIFSIALKEKSSGNIHVLDDDEFRSFCYVVMSIGEKIRDLAERLDIPDFILECLLHCLPYLDPTRQYGVSVNKLTELLPFDRVAYNSTANSLIISSGMNDYTVTLNSFLDEVYRHLYTDLKSISWDMYDILVTTKLTNEMDNEPSGFVKIHKLFRSMDGIFDTKRFKGLGTMDPVDLTNTCLIPDSRALFHIKNLGDAKVLFDMMGNDASFRKDLLSQNYTVE